MLEALICLAPFMFVYGLFKLIATDHDWAYEKWMHDIQGIRSERTETWEVSAKLQGIFLIFAAIAIFCIASYNR